MAMSRTLAELWSGPGSVPDHPEWGERYPDRALLLHARTLAHRRAVDRARRLLAAALEEDVDWRLALSCGKDSTCLAILAAEMGARVESMSVKDDLDYPGERQYLETLAARTGLPVEVVSPPVSLGAWLVDHRVSLVEDLHSRAAELSREHFYGLLDRYRAIRGYDGVILGLRQEESYGRRMNRAAHGVRYQRAYDGLHVSTPIADWRTEDVHAYLLARGVPLLPVYGCIDPGIDWRGLRKSWWIAGGSVASRGGHYAWLRRWWPGLYDIAIDIDPAVAEVA